MKPSCEMRATLSYETELAQTSHCAHEGIRFVNLLYSNASWVVWFTIGDTCWADQSARWHKVFFLAQISFLGMYLISIQAKKMSEVDLVRR